MEFQAYTLKDHDDWACIHIKAPESTTRTPVHLCCVLDTSASMDTSYKLDNVKHSLQFLLDFLGPQDMISIITFSDTARTILNRIIVNSTEKENIRTRISIIRAESNTNISAGIVQARESLSITNMKQGILLLTDGMANLGLIQPSDIMEIVSNTITQFEGTSISCIGYGIEHNADLLQSISSTGGGSYYVVNNLEDVAVVFGDILGGLMSCSFQQVRVILPNNTEIKSRYSTNIGDNFEIIIGDMPAGMEAAFLAKIGTGVPVLLKGYNLHTHTNFEITIPITRTDDTKLLINGVAHYLRFEVLALLEKSQTLLTATSTETETNVKSHIDKIKNCIDMITEYKQKEGYEHSLWDILITELNTCMNNLNNRRFNNIDTVRVMTQHTGYLGRLRGIPASINPDDIPPPIPLERRVFSNSTQRQISSQLAENVTPVSLIRDHSYNRIRTDTRSRSISNRTNTADSSNITAHSHLVISLPNTNSSNSGVPSNINISLPINGLSRQITTGC
jgi:hypothetical protein